MSVKSFDELEQEYVQKKARLAIELALCAALPTNGVRVTWLGEGGFEPDGNTRKPPIEKSIELVPSIVHSRSFMHHEHVAFRVPDSYDKGEYSGSPHYAEFRAKYLGAILDACEPHLISTVAWKGSRYATSYAPEGYNPPTERPQDYGDATITAEGYFLLRYSTSLEHGYASRELQFFINTAAGTCEVSFEVNAPGKLAPIPCNATRQGFDKKVTRVDSWRSADIAEVCASHKTMYGSGDYKKLSSAVRWLFADRAALMIALEGKL